MDTSEQNNFEENWRRAFDDASEMPPDSVWARIEERLDEEEKERVVVLPLWRRWQNMHWMAAAGVALLAISLGGWWLRQNTSSDTLRGNIAQNEAKVIVPNKEAISKEQNKKPTPEIASAEQTAQSTIEQKEDKQADENPLQLSKKTSIASTDNSSNQKNKAGATDIAKKLPKEWAIKEESTIAKTQSSSPLPVLSATPPSNSNFKENSLQTNDLITNQLTISTPIFEATPAVEINALDGKNLRNLPGLSKKQIWVAYQAPESSAEAPKKASTKEYWASVGIMPASYNAGVAIGGSSAGRAFAMSGQNALANTTNSTNAGSNRAALSYAVQWQGGLQLNQRWSIETGVNYLQGNSVFEGTNGFNVYTNSYVNNLEAAVNLSNNLTKQYDFASAGNDKSQIQSFATNQNISNAYQYLQVPVQAGFALVKPKRKLSLWLIGGFINNIFLRNSFESGQERIVSVSGADNPYKTLSLSASTGMRVQYKMSKRWTTLISGNYQQALGSNTRSDALFEAKPHLFGVGAGLRYGF
ncbi:hypothetical protein [Runella salmonicolor]|uniref:Outer membrane protein beta-barrel domain-containing protein n=1 Tax=Runella salmonicolor TaxID=2950278 RepID=A0ABT1FWK8_9BACT|nr:hypothetical protein [Runella salmonicolor]MCP1386159.1 hypothetical protein [Runella salmonicolor]